MPTDTRDARNWSGVANAYAASFAHLCAGTIPAVLARAALDSGESVVDVGAGSGLLSARIAATGARLTCVEPEQDMLAILCDVLPARVPKVRAGLPDLPFEDDSFDVAIAHYVINHVGDPRAGVRELARVARPGGRVLATGWTSRPTAQGTLFKTVMDRAGATPLEPDPLPPELDFERSVAGLAGLFTGAGLTTLVAEEVDIVWRTDPEAFWSALEAGVASMGKALLHQEPEVQLRMRAAYDDLCGELIEDGKLVLPAPAVLVMGRKEPTRAVVRPR